MPRERSIKKRSPGILGTSSVLITTWVALSWSFPAFSAEPAMAVKQVPPVSQLKLAPIDTRFSVGGNLGYTIRRDTIQGVATNSQMLVALVSPGVHARSYIWQPWFAQVSGDLSLNIYSTSNSSTTDAYASKYSSVSLGTTGNLTLNLVPASRFPFTAYINRTDNRQNVNYGAGGNNVSQQSTSYGMNQRYRTLDGQTNYYASYNHSLSTGAYYNVNERDYSSFSMNTDRFQNQSIAVTATASYTQNPYFREHSQENTLVASHSYQPGNGFNVISIANAGFTDYQLTQQVGQSSYLQLNSYATWQSDEKPLVVTGSARLSGARDGATDWASDTNANLGANYSLSEHFRVYGSVNVADKDGVQTVNTIQSAIGTYSPRPIDLGSGLRYTRNGTASLTNQTAPAGASQTFASGVGHGLNRNSSFADGNLFSSINQSLYASVSNPDNGATPRLQHNGTLSWDRPDNSGTTSLRLTADDSRDIGGNGDLFQLVNLQANRSEGLTRNSSLNGNLTTQKSRHKSNSSPFSTTTDSSASLSYNNWRAFDIPRMHFSSELRVAGAGFVPVVTGPDEMESRSWSNNINYAIGRIQLNFAANLSEARNIKYSTLLFNINRAF